MKYRGPNSTFVIFVMRTTQCVRKQILTEIVGARYNDLKLETFVTFEISWAELNSCYIRGGDDIMCLYANFDGNRKGSP